MKNKHQKTKKIQVRLKVKQKNCIKALKVAYWYVRYLGKQAHSYGFCGNTDFCSSIAIIRYFNNSKLISWWYIKPKYYEGVIEALQTSRFFLSWLQHSMSCHLRQLKRQQRYKWCQCLTSHWCLYCKIWMTKFVSSNKL